eukprot:GHRR01025065.1.p1 GENE.GHRR01025065.1~~GHRR01025065.1.p1  ORF type:complete len:206 (-),score=32.15 GHRR01025065.1:105-722(-)
MFGPPGSRPQDANLSSSPNWYAFGYVLHQVYAATGAERTAALCRGDVDKDISKLLEDIPRATSAPPHLQDRWAPVSNRHICSLPAVSARWGNIFWCMQGNADPAVSSRAWTGMEHADIRFDEDYARFYEAYSGQRKLPPPVEGRTLYSELGLLQQKQQLLAQQSGMLSSATPPPSQLLMGGGLTPGGKLLLLYMTGFFAGDAATT